jgi:hypothetical protein
MRKISHARLIREKQNRIDTELSDPRPRRIPGATITSWHGSPQIDLDALFSQPRSGPTVASATLATGSRHAPATVSLADGTKITFALSSQFNNESDS